MSLTTLYRSSKTASKRAYNAGYASACHDLLNMIQQGVSTEADPSREVTIGRIMDYIEARLEAIKAREEEEDEEEERVTKGVAGPSAPKPKPASPTPASSPGTRREQVRFVFLVSLCSHPRPSFPSLVGLNPRSRLHLDTSCPLGPVLRRRSRASYERAADSAWRRRAMRDERERSDTSVKMSAPQAIWGNGRTADDAHRFCGPPKTSCLSSPCFPSRELTLCPSRWSRRRRLRIPHLCSRRPDHMPLPLSRHPHPPCFPSAPCPHPSSRYHARPSRGSCPPLTPRTSHQSPCPPRSTHPPLPM